MGMRFIRRTAATICILLVLSVGIILTAIAIHYSFATQGSIAVETIISQYLLMLKQNPNTRVATFLAGLVLLLVSLITLYLAIRGDSLSPTIVVRTESGNVIVSASAIEDFIQRLGRTIDGIKDLRPNLILTKTGWKLDVRVTMWSDSSIPELRKRIEDQIKFHMLNLIGSEKIQQINVYVVRIVDRGRLTRRSSDIDFIT
ncbi:MAG: alkaline shock response membrane anchor protein AmaP [bacterium]|nr:alkaline shock response membrane anchor protein AmaP [bacterium]